VIDVREKGDLTAEKEKKHNAERRGMGRPAAVEALPAAVAVLQPACQYLTIHTINYTDGA